MSRVPARNPSPESVALIQRARDGDLAAWDQLCRRYYPAWLERFHGKLGKHLRIRYSTEDILQSAIGDALRHMSQLRDETRFFSWFCAIAKRKIARERVRHERTPPTSSARGVKVLEQVQAGEDLATAEEQVEVLDAMISLFDAYPDHMTALFLKYFHGLDPKALESALGKKERAMYYLLERGLALLGSRLRKSRGD